MKSEQIFRRKKQVENLNRLNKELEKRYMYYKEEFNMVKKKILDKNFRSITQSASKETILENARKKLEIYKKEYKSLTKLKAHRENDKSEIDLRNLNISLESKITKLIKSNKKLNKSNILCKSYEKKIDILSEIDIIQRYKEKINKIELSLENNKLIMKNNIETLESLKIEYFELKKTNSIPKIQKNNNFEKFKNLNEKLREIEGKYNCNIVRFKNRINELESTSQELIQEYLKTKTQLIKKDQQRRLIDMSKNETIIEKYRSITPYCILDSHPDVSFLYKPTLNRLYSKIIKYS